MKTKLNKLFGHGGRQIFLALGAFLTVGCGPLMKPVEHAKSPSGDFIIVAIPYQGKADPTKNGCIRLILETRAGMTLSAVQTGVSDVQKWAVGWMEKEDVVVLQSSDIGTQAFSVISNSLHQVALTPEIEARAGQLKSKKYER